MSIFANIASSIASSAGTQALAMPSASSSSATSTTGGQSFGNMLMSALGNVNAQQNTASSMAQDFAVGKTSDVQDVMVATEKATLALQLTTQIRNKVVDAYQQVMQISM